MSTSKRRIGSGYLAKAKRAWLRIEARARDTQSSRNHQETDVQELSDYFHVEVRPKDQFILFRTQEVGEHGGIHRVSGKLTSGSWDDQKWLISKDEAHVEDRKLVADSQEAREVIDKLGSAPRHLTGNLFRVVRPRIGRRTGVGKVRRKQTSGV